MKAPVSNLKDADMQAAPYALMRAAEKARRLAEQTGTPFIVRSSVSSLLDTGRQADESPVDGSYAPQEISHEPATTPTSETPPEELARDAPGHRQ